MVTAVRRRRARKKSNKKGLIFSLIIVTALLGATAYFSYISFNINSYKKLVYPGIKIEEIDLSGKSKEEALKLVNQKYQNAMLKKNIIVKTPNKEYTINYSKLNARYNIEEAVNEAYDFGKNKGFFDKFNLINKPSSQEINLKFKYDQKPIDELVKQIEKDVNKKVEEGSIKKLANGNFNVISGQSGQALDTAKLKKDILEKINGKIEKDIFISAKINEIKPKFSEEDLKKVNTKVATYTTDFSTSANGRATNIDIATKAIDGTVLMPGDTFSFNDIVGRRSADKGYQPAGVIVGDKIESGLGGGVCQVSTTLYNAIIRMDIPSTQRINHTMPSHYAPKGLDATVDFDSGLDYKFKNTLSYPIYIEGCTKNRKVVFNVYSNSGLTNKTYDFVNDVYETIEPKTNYVNDATLAKGAEVVKTEGMQGFRVKVYKITYENGKQISKDLLSTNYYPPVNRVIRRGTK